MAEVLDIPLSSMLGWTPGPWEIVIIVVVILLLFGGRKLPELARGLGKGLRLFKKELKGVKDDVEEAGDDSDEKDKTDTPTS